jgi:hypothetical protein
MSSPSATTGGGLAGGLPVSYHLSHFSFSVRNIRELSFALVGKSGRLGTSPKKHQPHLNFVVIARIANFTPIAINRYNECDDGIN